MIETLALVTKVLDNNTVECTQGMQGLCGGCTEKSEDCAPEVFTAKKAPQVFILPNTLHASVNQVVRVGIPARSVLVSALICYGLPLCWLIMGAGIGMWLASLYQLSPDWSSILGAFIGLLIGMLLAFSIAHVFINRIWNPRMLGILPVKTCVTKKATTISQA